MPSFARMVLMATGVLLSLCTNGSAQSSKGPFSGLYNFNKIVPCGLGAGSPVGGMGVNTGKVTFTPEPKFSYKEWLQNYKFTDPSNKTPYSLYNFPGDGIIKESPWQWGFAKWGEITAMTGWGLTGNTLGYQNETNAVILTKIDNPPEINFPVSNFGYMFEPNSGWTQMVFNINSAGTFASAVGQTITTSSAGLLTCAEDLKLFRGN